MNLKFSIEHEYKGKKLSLYESDNNELFIKKETNISNYELLLKISEITNNSDNLLDISGFYKKDEILVYFVPFIKANTLEELIDNNVILSSNEIYDILYQLCLGLKELHNSNIIHRDIKPGNILYTDDKKIIIIDYDISREFKVSKGSDTTKFGTKGFAPPEQFGYSQTTKLSDIFSLGKTIEMLVNNCYKENDFYLKNVYTKCSEIDPKNRYKSIEEIISVLRDNNFDFFSTQIKQFENGISLGLSNEDIEIYANNKLNAKQMGVIKHSLVEGVSRKVIDIMREPLFDSRQMWQIKQGYIDGLCFDDILLYAKINYSSEEMHIFRNGLKYNKELHTIFDNINFYNTIRYANVYNDYIFKGMHYAFSKGLDANLVKVICNNDLSEDMIRDIIQVLIKEL